MRKNETHKEKMMRKKMERKNRGSTNAPSNITWITNQVGLPVEDDPNRVVIKDYLKSQFYKDNVELGLKEEFIGGFKTLRNDPFFASVISNKGSMKKIEDDCINRGHYFHSTGDFSGIKHIAYWSTEYECLLAWRLVPEGLNMMGMVA